MLFDTTVTHTHTQIAIKIFRRCPPRCALRCLEGLFHDGHPNIPKISPGRSPRYPPDVLTKIKVPFCGDPFVGMEFKIKEIF